MKKPIKKQIEEQIQKFVENGVKVEYVNWCPVSINKKGKITKENPPYRSLNLSIISLEEFKKIEETYGKFTHLYISETSLFEGHVRFAIFNEKLEAIVDAICNEEITEDSETDGVLNWSCTNYMGGIPKKLHTLYPSRYAIDEKVNLNFFNGNKIEHCLVKAVKFTKSKVRYDLHVPMSSPSDAAEADVDYTTVYDIDSVCVEDFIKIEQVFEIDSMVKCIGGDYPPALNKEGKVIAFNKPTNSYMIWFTDKIHDVVVCNFPKIPKGHGRWCEFQELEPVCDEGSKFIKDELNNDECYILTSRGTDGVIIVTTDYEDVKNLAIEGNYLTQIGKFSTKKPIGQQRAEKYKEIMDSPSKFNLSEIFEQLKFGRPAANQDYLDKCIAELNSSTEDFPDYIVINNLNRLTLSEKLKKLKIGLNPSGQDYIDKCIAGLKNENPKAFVCFPKLGLSAEAFMTTDKDKAKELKDSGDWEIKEINYQNWFEK